MGRGIGKLIATGLQEHAARRGARRIQNGVFEADSAGRRLLESLGYGAVRGFREMRIEPEAPPPATEWPDGLRVVAFDPERDALEFHAAHEEAFADSWDYTPRDLESRSKGYLGSERFDPTLWCVLRAADEIAAGTICTGDTYGGGFVHALFMRRPCRKQGVGAAPQRLVRAVLGARGAQRRARRRRGERHRRVPPLRARRHGARAWLGHVRESDRRCYVSCAPRTPRRCAGDRDCRRGLSIVARVLRVGSETNSSGGRHDEDHRDRERHAGRRDAGTGLTG